MAFYQCFVPVGSLDADTRAAAAEAITTVHSAVIGVPPEFVNVVYTEYDPTAFYTEIRCGRRTLITTRECAYRLT
jgi:phenylpyruvate tautomerase PptA (4-oxalocrotonate tautomerase family)